MVYLKQNALAAFARPTLMRGAIVDGVVDARSQFLRGQPNKSFFASGPNSTTAYSATVSIWTTFDGVTWDPTPLVLVVTNVAPDNSTIVQTPAMVFVASMVVNSGTISVDGASNGRNGIDIGVEG